MTESHYSIYFDSLKASSEKDKRSSSGRESYLKVNKEGGREGAERREGKGRVNSNYFLCISM